MIVTNITSRPVNTKFGPKPAYDVYLDGVKHSYGFKKPGFVIGNEIDCTINSDAYGLKIEPASVVVKGGAAIPPATASAPTTAPSRAYSGPPAKVFPIPALHGDRAIVRQNSVTNAVKLLVESTALPKLDTMTTEELCDLVILIARKLEAYSCGDLDQASAEAALASEV